MTQPGLITLLGADDKWEFMRQAWPDKAFVAWGPPERLQGMFGCDLEQLVRLQRTYARCHLQNLCGQYTFLKVERGQERTLYNAGHTIYFHRLVSPELDQWKRALERDLGLLPGLTHISSFASRCGKGTQESRSSGMHYDLNDNFICQVRGTKRWRIAANTHVRNPSIGYTIGASPTPAHEVEAPQGLPTGTPEDPQTIELRPGTVMFVPRGVWHDTETVADESGDESLHFNIQLGVVTWKMLAEYILLGTTLLHDEELRAPIREVFEAGTVQSSLIDELRGRLARVFSSALSGRVEIDAGELATFLRSIPEAGPVFAGAERKGHQ